MQRLNRTIIILALCFVITGVLWASETGEIRGRVLDEEGGPLPGVTITAKSSQLQGSRTAITDDKGLFKLPLLPFGIYSLTFELPSFSELTQSGYHVRLDFTISIEVVLQMEAIAEEVSVTAEQPLIDKTKVDTSYRINTDDLNRAPIQARTIQELVAYTPGVTGVRADTIIGSGIGLPSFRGEGVEGNNYLVDDLSIHGSRFNDPGVTLNYDAWEEVQVVSDRFSPDWGQALGGTVNIVTKSGGNEFHGYAAERPGKLEVFLPAKRRNNCLRSR
ncbi:MAG: TonB-dependent receptor [Candidatus Aminicenantes bacterium]|nr:MAG: TonB-dependent receptor [Candidatus Aminicenantes bacterium]